MNLEATQDVQPGKSQNKQILRRKFLLVVLVAAFCIYFYSPFKPKAFQTKKKIVILGFDGADPRLVERWSADLPNLQKLAGSGTGLHLRSSCPPESPVAWSSFAIGAGPGKHGVFDFLRRPAGSYMPSMESFVKKINPRFILSMIPIRMPKAILRRGGIAFWDVLSKAGIRTNMIEVPVTFPPPKLTYGRSLSGLGVPDIRGTQQTPHRFVYSNSDSAMESDSTMGSKIVRLEKKGDWYTGFAWGPYDPIVEQKIRDKDRDHLEAALTKHEWAAHINSLKGERDFTPEDKAITLDFLNTEVCALVAYQENLDNPELEERIQRIKDFLLGVKPTYVKEKGVDIPTARERGNTVRIQADQLNKELSELSGSDYTIKCPVDFQIVDSETVAIRVGGETKQTKLNTWSDWFTLSFKILPIKSARAVCRFYPQAASESSLKVYMTSPDIDPRDPIIPVSHPTSYSKELADWLGEPYKTRGWAAETSGLEDGILEEQGFLDDLFYLMGQREKKLMETWDRTDSNVFISVFSETDRAAHMFYRFIDEGHPMYDAALAAKFGDALKSVYVRMDQIVGRMMEKIGHDPDTTLIVMSDHGFSPFRYQVQLNKWLYDNGYMKLNVSSLEATHMKLEDLLKKDNSGYFKYVDWKGTRAYAMGLGQIYINLKGREPLGIVDPKDYDALCDEIASKLSVLKDDREGRNQADVVAYVKKRSEIWVGPYGDDAHDCPDLQACFNTPYRVSWQTCLGGISPGHVLEDNLEHWSGDHCSLAPEMVPGMFFCNKKLNVQDVSIYDFCPSVLRYFGLKVPDGVEGKDFLS